MSRYEPNLNMEMEKLIQELPEGTPLLLHSCCGPCSSGALERLAGHFDVSLFFYNPNIQPADEYEKRLESQQKLAKQYGGVKLIEGKYEPERFFNAVNGYENAGEGGAKNISPRCEACFRLRLSETAKHGAANGFNWFCSTLSVGPRKNAALVFNIGKEQGNKAGINFLPADFKKKNGYKRSMELSEQYGLYRQEYCGCIFSLNQ